MKITMTMTMRKSLVFIFSTLIANSMVIDIFGAPVRNGKIAFTSDRDGNEEIYAMNSDGSNQVRLTDNGVVDNFASWAPNGRLIAFVSQRADASFAIFIMNANGSNRKDLTSISGNFALYKWLGGPSITWSPDSMRLAYDSGGDIFVINADGSGKTNLTSLIDTPIANPSWSPDGASILVRGGYQIQKLSLQNPSLQPVTVPTEHEWDDNPTWSLANGRIMLVRSFDMDLPKVLIGNADGSELRVFDECVMELNVVCDSHRTRPVFSPDGSTVVFHVWWALSDGAQIFRKDLNDTHSVQLTSTGRNYSPSWQKSPKTGPFDIDGDGIADPSVFRPDGQGVWYALGSQTGFMGGVEWGIATDKIVPADYDGDGKTDVAVYRDGTWWVLNSNGGASSIEWGITTDVPVPADYDGDGKADMAVYRDGTWWILYANGSGATATEWGIATDVPVPADYDGDGKADLAVYRNGTWWVLNSNGGGISQTDWGIATDIPVPADYDGDSKTDIAVYRDGDWWVMKSNGGGITQTNWGIATDKPVPADYDGDGKADLSVYRDGDWWTMKSNGGGITQTNWGIPTDIPIPMRSEP